MFSSPGANSVSKISTPAGVNRGDLTRAGVVRCPRKMSRVRICLLAWAIAWTGCGGRVPDGGWPDDTDSGEVDIEVPRDRDGSFDPVVVKKRQRRLGGVDTIVLSLVAKGLTTGGHCRVARSRWTRG